MINGIIGFVLEEYDDTVYCIACDKDIIGVTDICPAAIDAEKDEDLDVYKRKFTLMVLSEWCEAVTLNLDDFESFANYHPDIFSQIF